MSTTLPPVTAGPILLNESPASEIFFNESASEFSWESPIDETDIRINKTEILKNLDIEITRDDL